MPTVIIRRLNFLLPKGGLGGEEDFPNILNEGTRTVFQNNIPWEKGIDGCKIKCLTLALFSSGSNSHKLV